MVIDIKDKSMQLTKAERRRSNQIPGQARKIFLSRMTKQGRKILAKIAKDEEEREL